MDELVFQSLGHEAIRDRRHHQVNSLPKGKLKQLLVAQDLITPVRTFVPVAHVADSITGARAATGI